MAALKQQPLVGAVGRRHAAHLPRRADDRQRQGARAWRPSVGPPGWCSPPWRSGRLRARARARPIAGTVERTLLGSLRARPLRGGCSTSSSRTCRRLRRQGKPLEHDWPKLATALAALWPALWLAAAWPIAARRDGLRPDRRARRGSRSAASATPCCPGSAWPSRWSSPSPSPTSPPSATRRSTWPTSAPPAPAR